VGEVSLKIFLSAKDVKGREEKQGNMRNTREALIIRYGCHCGRSEAIQRFD